MNGKATNVGIVLAAAVAFSFAFWATGCSSSEKPERPYVHSDSAGKEPAPDPAQKIEREAPPTSESERALHGIIASTQARSERERARNEQLRVKAAVSARAHPSRSVWRKVYSFPLLYTGLSAATGALIGSTRGDAWQGAVIGAAAGSFIDMARRGSDEYPYGAGMIAGAGLGAVIGQSAGSAAGGALIGVASGAVMDNIIYSETRRQE